MAVLRETVSGYDSFGRLVSINNDNYTAAYAYNPDGLRVLKSVTENGITISTRYSFEGGNITLELDSAGNQTAYNAFGGDTIISRKTGVATYYYIYNGRGDVVQLTDSTGAVVVTYDYDAFGNLLMATQGDVNPFRYCGEFWDYETKNYYLRSRYYNPSTGRFTQRDSYLVFCKV